MRLVAALLNAIPLLCSLSPVKAATGRLEKLQHAASVFRDVVRGKHSLEYSGQVKGLTVIGTDFPRTGAKSIEAALSLLGHRI